MGSSPKKEKEEAVKIEREINDLFEPFFAVFGFESIKEKNFPILDVYESAENIFIEAELPGVNKNSISINVSEGELVIEGEKIGGREVSEKVNYICIERSFGKFRRTVEIPAVANTGRIKARYSGGVLLITIPKITEQRMKNVKIEIES